MSSLHSNLGTWASASLSSHVSYIRKDGSFDRLVRGRGFCHCSRERQREHAFRRSLIAVTSNAVDPDSSPKFPLDWDPFEDLYGLGLDLRSRNGDPTKQQSRLKKPQGGQTLKDMPCPTCRGRGYVLCARCSSRNLDFSCPECSGRGYYTCQLCEGERVVWEQSLNESAWASLHSRSPLKIAEDEAIESMDIPSVPKRKTRRVYGTPPPETREKISRALKDFEARTGSFSRRLREVYEDPILHAERVAAIKKARGTVESRKLTSNFLKEYFKSPENRLKRSQSMIGVRFTCTACGEEGHRRHFCPTLGYKSKKTVRSEMPIRMYRCSSCGQVGHGCRRCPKNLKSNSSPQITGERGSKCGLCHALGHTKRTCPNLKKKLCSVCSQPGHNKRTCPTFSSTFGSKLTSSDSGTSVVNSPEVSR